jgi:bifunctional enzyme CysN/CysC
MDLVDYQQAPFEKIRDELRGFASRLEVSDLTFVPISALHGENVVTRSEKMPWYQGASLLHHLEEVHIASDRNLIDLRFPVQTVIRPMSKAHPDYRAYAGQLAAGVLRPGDEVMALPSGFTTTVEAVELDGVPLPEAFPPMSVSVRLKDALDLGRGDMLCRPRNQPTVDQNLDAMICWMAEEPLRPGAKYLLKHTTRSVRALVRGLSYRLDVNTLHRDEAAQELGLNDIGRVSLRAQAPLFFDEYRRNRTTGSFILIDELTHATVGGGILTGAQK